MHQLDNKVSANEVQFITSIRLLHVSVPTCDSQGVLWKKGNYSTTRQSADWCVERLIFVLPDDRKPAAETCSNLIFVTNCISLSVFVA